MASYRNETLIAVIALAVLALGLLFPLSSFSRPPATPPKGTTEAALPSDCRDGKCNTHKIDFDPLETEEDAAKLGVPPVAMKASRQLVDKFNSGCSSTVISKTGHVLTALHCIDDCLGEKNYLTQELIYDDGDAKGYRHTLPYAKGRTCTYKINNKPVEMEIISTGYCFGVSGSLYDELEEAKPYQEVGLDLRKKKCPYEDDFAILKIKSPNPEISCAPVAVTDAKSGDKVISVGYPSATKRKVARPAAKDSENASLPSRLYASNGVVRSKYTCDWKTENGTVETHLLEQYRDLYKPLLQVTADAAQGSSGGSIVNPQGTLLGVMVRIINFKNETHECAGALHAVKASTIRAKVEADLGKEEAKKVFDCK